MKKYDKSLGIRGFMKQCCEQFNTFKWIGQLMNNKALLKIVFHAKRSPHGLKQNSIASLISYNWILRVYIDQMNLTKENKAKLHVSKISKNILFRQLRCKKRSFIIKFELSHFYLEVSPS